MPEMTQLEKLKLQLDTNGDSQDDALTLLLEDVETDILSWTNRSVLLPALLPTQRQIAIIRYNMQGVEGQTAHSEGGISRSFDDLPQSIRSTIVQHRLAKLVSYGAT